MKYVLCVRSINDKSGIRGATSKEGVAITFYITGCNIYKTNRANTNVVTSDSEGGCRVNNKINTICIYVYVLYIPSRHLPVLSVSFRTNAYVEYYPRTVHT